MSVLRHIFDVFSRRPSPQQKPLDVPRTTRHRVILWVGEIFGNSRSDYGTGDYRIRFWEEIHRYLQYRHGRLQLAREIYPGSRGEDALNFLLGCRGEEFLDFLEYIFRVDCFFHVALPDEQVVDELNDLLRVDNLPYFVTNFVKEEVRETINHFGFSREATVVRTLEYPRVVMRESEAVHAEAIVPALLLLQKSIFANANHEFLEAMDDYRRGDFGDSLTKCCSSLESVLKVLCKRKRWSYSESDSAGNLIRLYLQKSNLENYFEPALMIVSTLRNRLSKAHGAGAVSKEVPRHVARYAINATASALLLLAEEAEEN